MPKELIEQPEQIGLSSPADHGDLRLSLFLYNVRESGEFRQNQLINAGNGNLQYPPISLELFYLITAYSKAESHSKSQDEAMILGKVMQIFHDHSILRSSYLHGSLAEKNEEIRITLDNLHTDVLIRLWNFPNTPYKLSLSYMVGPVLLDSKRKKATKRVEEVVFDVKG